jgi:hypothetical protein
MHLVQAKVQERAKSEERKSKLRNKIKKWEPKVKSKAKKVL